MLGRLKREVCIAGVLVVLAGSLLFGCGAVRTSADTEGAEAARAALLPFKQRLMAALQEGLARGPEEAIDACRLEAPRIASSLSSESLRVGRTSHRLRNPENAPRSWMRPILQEFLESSPGEQPYRMVRIDGDWVGYAEPIYMQPVCLTCHGTDLSAPLRDRLRTAYPHDQATGFAPGDFRGMFWVELEAGADAVGG